MVIVNPSITARTERLLLRPLQLEDAPDVFLMRSDPECMKHTSQLPDDSVEKSKAWIQGCHDRENNWNFAIELLPTAHDYNSEQPRVVGMIGAVRAPEIGYMFNQKFWGKGYATEALRAFIPLFFEYCPNGENGRYDYAEAMTDPELVASQNVLQKTGFKFVELREKDFENPVLGTRDTMIYTLSR